MPASPRTAPARADDARRPDARGRGPVAAWPGPQQVAEAAVAAGDFLAAAGALRPRMREFAATLNGGRYFELWACCGAEGVADIDVRQALRAALDAYQDAHEVAGMARCHAALGEFALGRGELEVAAREYGYADALFARHGSTRERVRTLGRRAHSALHLGEFERTMGDCDAALQLCRALDAPPEVEAEARLLRAQALAAFGQPQAAARELLWAERLAAGAQVASPTLTLARAEGLLATGHPRRAASVLRPLQLSSGAPQNFTPQLAAHALRLEGEAALQDAPGRAATVLDQAQRRFAALGQAYHRIACELALVRALHRTGAPDAPARLEALAAARLQRWPRLAAGLAHAQAELERAPIQVPGAVRAPWTQAIGHHTGQVAVRAEAPSLPAEGVPEGLLGRLQSALGRFRSGARVS